jgi:uncharacterized protein
MNKNIAIFLTMILALMQFNSIGQIDKTNLTERIIEVTGTAEMLINPNEYTFKIILNERFENKEKITIDKQEGKLKEELINIGIEIQKDLTIADMSSVFTTQKRKKDVIGSKEFYLKIYDLTKIERLQQIADKLDVGKLDLIQATHTELAKFRKETKMEAVKVAKLKAEYMLEAIGEKLGKPILIQEILDYSDYQNYTNTIQRGELSSNSMISMQEVMKSGETLSFSKIKLKYNILTRFEIK